MSNEIDKKLFEQIFGHTLIKLADKLINTTNKEENQIIVKNIEKSKDKLLEMHPFNDWVIQPNSQRIDLLDTIKLILDFNEKFNYENENENEDNENENKNEDNEKENENEDNENENKNEDNEKLRKDNHSKIK